MVKNNTKKITKEDILTYYNDYLQTHGAPPITVMAFCKAYKLNTGDFFNLFNSLNSVENEIWKKWFVEVLQTLEQDENFAGYSVREKILAFYYTWLDVLKENRGFVLMRLEGMDEKSIHLPYFSRLKGYFEEFVEDMLMEGKDTNEIADRPFSQYYIKGFWFQFIMITRYWANDESEEYEKTDVMVEKSINFLFDLIGKGPIDSFMDLAKFLYQQNSRY